MCLCILEAGFSFHKINTKAGFSLNIYAKTHIYFFNHPGYVYENMRPYGVRELIKLNDLRAPNEEARVLSATISGQK